MKIKRKGPKLSKPKTPFYDPAHDYAVMARPATWTFDDKDASIIESLTN